VPRAILKDQAKVLEQLQKLHIKPPGEAALVDGAIKGMIDALGDPYSSYLGPDEFADLERRLGGALVGIGVQLKEADGRFLVEAPLPGSPAQKAGLRPGDEILEVDGRPIRGLKTGDVVARVVGPEGTVVKLAIARPDGKEETVEITRRPIKVPTVAGVRPADSGRGAWMVDPERKIGYARIAQFSPTTPDELKDAIRSMQDEGMKAMILDLRTCPGGILSSAIEAANLFLRGGTIVSIRGRDGALTTAEADPAKALGDFPLVVLVNEQTASAAEVVSGALQARNRAVVVGARTFGKGSIQAIVKLEGGGGAIKLTTAYYTLPDGRNIDKGPGKASWGVDPDDGDFVPMDARQLEAIFKRRAAGAPGGDRDDVQLAAGLKALSGKLETGEFPKVGQPPSALSAYAGRLDEIRLRRDSLKKDLDRVEKELEALNKAQKAPGERGAPQLDTRPGGETP
jgi:carboxyl-terminal processing protease